MFSTEQQTVFNWLKDILQLPVYADVYKGALEFLDKKPSGYITFASHAGRDLINCLANTTIGADRSRDEYKNNLDDLKKCWKKEWGAQGKEELHLIPSATCKLVQKLIVDDEAGHLRASELVDLFFNTFLDYADREKIAPNLYQKSEKARKWFKRHAHVREPDFRDNVPSEVEMHFRTLDELLYVAACSQFGRIKILDGILKSKKKPKEGIIVDRALELIKNRFDHQYFITRLKNPLWIQPLVERGYFQSPPKIRYYDDGNVLFPPWPELQYLKNVSRDVPEKVVNLVLELPKVDNPSVYDGILEIALRLQREHSAKLMPKILESLELEHQVWTYRYADLLAHWTKENQVEAALKLSKILVAFVPDPRDKDKRKRRKDMSQDSAEIATIVAETQLEPSPRIDQMEYHRIISEGVRPLAEKEPYKVACILIDATADMIRLRTHWENFDKGVDYSEFWCERFAESEDNYEVANKSLVHALAFACQQVYELRLDSIHELDNGLRNQQWRIFNRLRQHLYAQYPIEQTKPWIREWILTYEDYNQSEVCYEFKQMIQSACEHFGTALLTEEERKHIFDCIRNGPSRDGFTEEEFRQRQSYFHRKQLKPFASVLFGENKNYFHQLETEAEGQISDDDYPPLKTRGGHVFSRSPHLPEDLAKLTDEKLLTCINEWDEKRELFEGNNLIEVDIAGLAAAFQTVFTKHIIPVSKRLRFWMENRKKIERPIYVQMMINGIKADVKEKHFDNLNAWLTFSEWVLSHPDQELDEDYRLGTQGDESRENPNWYNSRRAVGDFIEVCLKEDVDVPISARRQLSTLLEMLCTQFDSWLDRDKRHLLNQNDLITEGINNTRSRALEALIQFGFWLRRHDSESEVPEVTTILERRFSSETGHPLTLPEYAILGRDYRLTYNLNKAWATEHKSDFFPQGELPTWLAAFNSFMRYNSPFKAIFEILRDDFDIALQHLEDFKKQDFAEGNLTETLGDHLFHYYIWDMYPLKGENSLLERFYQVTEHDRKQWASLFDCVGRTLWTIGGQLENCLKDKLGAFYDWRFEIKEPIELQKFTYWLKANCLDAEWRLDEFSKILDVCKAEEVSIAIQLEALCEMLPNHTAKVVECFAKLTDRRGDDNIYIRTEEAKTILKAGLASPEQDVHENAKRAHDNLLRVGRFDLLDLDD